MLSDAFRSHLSTTVLLVNDWFGLGCGVGELLEHEVQRLWAEWTTCRDAKTRNLLASHYLPFVKRIASQLERKLPSAYRGDLYGFGVIGLFNAIERFDVSLGYRFETFSYRRICGAMNDGLRAFDWLPRDARRLPGRALQKVVCVDFQAASDYGRSIQDSFADPDSDAVLERLDLEGDYEEVAEAIASGLTPRERTVILAHYFERRNLADIGRELGVTESRVSQLHRQALSRLRNNLTRRLSA